MPLSTRRKYVVTLIVLFVASSARLAIADVIFADGTFNPADWASAKILDTTPSQAASFAVDQLLSGGDPGSYQRNSLTWSATGGASQGIVVAALKTGAIYDPSSQGAIDAIDFSFNHILLGQMGGTPEPFLGLLLFQNDSYYGHLTASTSAFAWSDRMVLGLKASDFSLLSGLGPTVPDFGPDGSRIQFGYRASSAATHAGTFTITSGIDNWHVRVTAVPEPSSLATAGLGLLSLAGHAARRRFRSATSET